MSAPVSPDALAALRGYHFPEPVSWWPPAPGWWLLAALLLALMVTAALALLRRWRRRAALRAALRELASLDAAQSDSDPASLARQLSRLLRRFALTRFPHREVAGLAGDDWVRFVDAHGAEGQSGERIGRLLQDAPYRPGGDVAATAQLAALVRSWILHNAGGRRR